VVILRFKKTTRFEPRRNLKVTNLMEVGRQEGIEGKRERETREEKLLPSGKPSVKVTEGSEEQRFGSSEELIQRVSPLSS
jgi:hypothetical protein